MLERKKNLKSARNAKRDIRQLKLVLQSDIHH